MEQREESMKYAILKDLHESGNVDLELALRNTRFELDETQDFTYYKGYNRGWNTYCTYLRLYPSIQFYELVRKNKDIIHQYAVDIYGKQGYNFLVETYVHMDVDHNEVIGIGITTRDSVVVKAVEDAETLMLSGQYDKAFDRVHTAFHGYLKEILIYYGVNLNQHANVSKLYTDVCNLMVGDITPIEAQDAVKKVVRSANGMISAVNEIRNNYSLAHPNENIIGKAEAKLVIGLVRNLVEYINQYLYF